MRPSFPHLLAALAAVAAAHGDAAAGRTPYGWLQDVEVAPERGAEIETWVSELNQWHRDLFDTEENWSFFGWAAAVGVTDQLELRVPVELTSSLGGGGTGLKSYGGELRYRILTSDPVEAPPVVPLARLRVQRMYFNGRVDRIEPGAVVSADVGRVKLTADLAVSIDVDQTADEHEVDVSYQTFAGASIALACHLRVGAEGGGVIAPGAFERRRGAAEPWFGLGPNAAWSHGRTWISGALYVGTAHIGWAPRVNLGIAF
ncbi:MAG TPA: hypothetical protein VMZ28_04170 [Kofleriaceae bacterium]|nr:hypothetical protein [Kofleriaceae bacterium]